MPLRRAAFFNRELSWLAFNRRVLEQAQMDKFPLLERVKFMAIAASNLDEFFEIRVAGLVQQVENDSGETSIDGLGPREQLRRIHLVVASMVEHMYQCWQTQLLPGLEAEGIRFRKAEDLDEAEKTWARTYFREQLFPLLTPLAIDPAHPFPHIANKSLNVLCSLNRPETPEIERIMALVPVPRSLPRIVPIGTRRGGLQTYCFISSILKLCVSELFPGHEVLSAHVFRVTRNSDLYIDEEEAENLLQRIEAELRNRRRGAAVRLEVEHGVDPELFSALLEHLKLQHEYVFRVDGPLNLQGLTQLYEIVDRPDLKFPPFEPDVPEALRDPSRLFEAIRARDRLLHHPYESFQPVVDFIAQAARDPDVLSIRQTLYRTSGDSPIVRALMEASRNGKEVTALVELKARFDEENNIQWARQLEEAGVHVVYGMVGKKIHAKVSLVVRREGSRLRAYAHLGTGNYHPRTARIYTDLSLFTCDRAITSEILDLFHALTGFGRTGKFRYLLVAPHNLHTRIQQFIRREAANARKGLPSGITIKVNSLVDRETILALYEASRCGVPIQLIVRGICALVPGVRGLSESIHVRSIVGRFLEHSRIYYFLNAGGEPVVLLGSADWMPRNFFRRVEVVFPVRDPELRRRVVDEILALLLADDRDARELHPSGAYLPIRRPSGRHPFQAQQAFMALAQRETASPTLATADTHPAPARTRLGRASRVLETRLSRCGRGHPDSSRKPEMLR